MKNLKRCPVCQEVPQLHYCCGEYLIGGADPACPACGNAFTEMHSNEQMEIEAWNRRVERWEGRHYCGSCDFVRPPDMRCMCQDSQWAGVTVKRDNYCRHWEPRIDFGYE